MDSNTQQTSPWTTKRLLEWTAEYLQKAQIDQPRLCAEILLADVLNCKRIDLYVRFDYCPQPEELTRYRQLVRRCAQQEPPAYLTGKANFYSLEFTVSPAVLIPRQETETLVTQAIDFLTRETNRPTVDVLDLCTGSGCIAVAIASNVIEAEIIATDISPEALQIARYNIEKYDLQSRVTLLQSDLWAQIDRADKGIFDLIVSNPPYISTAEYAQLEPNVRKFEPPQALLAGEDGLDYYRRIIEQAQACLADNASLMLEVAYNQAQEVVALCEQSGYLRDIRVIKDTLGHQRVVKANKN